MWRIIFFKVKWGKLHKREDKVVCVYAFLFLSFSVKAVSAHFQCKETRQENKAGTNEFANCPVQEIDTAGREERDPEPGHVCLCVL